MNNTRRMVIILFGLLCGLYVFQGGPLLLYADESDPYAPYDKGIPEGWKIIEGDILVPIKPPLEGVFATNFWPKGIVPYEFDTNVSATNQALMVAAMKEWKDVSTVDFVVRNGQSDYIHIQNSTQNSSSVGRQGGKQVVNIFNWNWRFIMVHELGHALGPLARTKQERS